VIFVDSNIPMYLIGADHPNKAAARRLVEQAVADRERLVTSVEVLQEILHRYTPTELRQAIAAAFELIFTRVDEVFPVVVADVERARAILESVPRVSARDAIHLAVMERHGVERVLTFDAAFDAWPGVRRVGTGS
jgi:predicted nucleic acid-binding protein